MKNKSLNNLHIVLLVSFVLLLFSGIVVAQKAPAKSSEPKDSLNQKDKRNRKQGTWFFRVAPLRGEPGYSSFGNYRDDKKTGAWYKLDIEGRLMSVEHFRDDILDGTAQYYEQGKLVCMGNYRGFTPQQKIDSVWVTDPVTLYDTLVAIENYVGALKHGTWRYYDPNTGQLIKEEVYQVDDLVYQKKFTHTSVADSIRKVRHLEQLPHNKKQFYSPPAGKRNVIGG